MLARLDLAQQRGCDGVEPDNVQSYDDDTGFELTAADQLAFNRRVADEAHARGLAVGLKNGGGRLRTSSTGTTSRSTRNATSSRNARTSSPSSQRGSRS